MYAYILTSKKMKIVLPWQRRLWRGWRWNRNFSFCFFIFQISFLRTISFRPKNNTVGIKVVSLDILLANFYHFFTDEKDDVGKKKKINIWH